MKPVSTMVEIDKDYQGHKEWKPWCRQEIIADEGEGLQDVVAYMRAHLEYFKVKLTFNYGEIQQNGNRYYIILTPYNSPPAHVHFEKGQQAIRFTGGLRF